MVAAASAACGKKGSDGFHGGDALDSGASDDARMSPGVFTEGGTCVDDSGCQTDQTCVNGLCLSACDIAKQDRSSIGCDYYSVAPGSSGFSEGDCFAAYVANTSTTDAATIEVTYNGQPLDIAGLARIPSGTGTNITYAPLPNGKLPAGQIAILFLMNHPTPFTVYPISCPAGVTAGLTTANGMSSKPALINAFHITTSEPVVAYDIYPYGGASAYVTSATLLVPTSAWDTNYIAVDAYAPFGDPSALTEPFIQITAAQPGTQVTINPTAAIVGGVGVSSARQGMPYTYTLDAGEVLQLKQQAELNGSVIQSNNPVGVWGGHSCMMIDVNDAACDSAHQQLFPVRALGSEYVAVKHRDRTSFVEQPPWRLVGAVDGTTLKYTPPVAGAPATINKGQLVSFNASGPFVVTSQDASHPFYIGGHMTGQNSQGQDFGTGDPEWVNIVPPAQYMGKYTFFTDPTMRNTNLVVVRRKAQDGTFKDVSLHCMSAPLSGWQPIGASNYEYTRVDITVESADAGTGVNGCDNGLHEMHSDEPFGVTVWGWDNYVSYAYPAGAKVEFINDVIAGVR
jgi:hypothetical protein